MDRSTTHTTQSHGERSTSTWMETDLGFSRTAFAQQAPALRLATSSKSRATPADRAREGGAPFLSYHDQDSGQKSSHIVPSCLFPSHAVAIALLESPNHGSFFDQKHGSPHVVKSDMIVPGSLEHWCRCRVVSRRWALTHLRDVSLAARARGAIRMCNLQPR